MVSALILFGLRLAPLYHAIAQVESDRGVTERNVYQIKRIYVDDVNRIYNAHYCARDVLDADKSEMMMYLYWKHYAYMYAKETKRQITYEVLAKMHNRGGRYWTQGWDTQVSAEKYWRRVSRQMLIGGIKTENGKEVAK